MRELARRADIDPSTVSRVLSYKQNPGNDFYLGVARSFGVTLESVERLERAGTIPENKLDDPRLKELTEIAQRLEDGALDDVLDFARYKFQKSQNVPPTSP